MSTPSKTQDPCESPPTPTFCAKNCGFFANPECGGMCSVCFKRYHLSKQKKAATEAKELKKPEPMPSLPPTSSNTEAPPHDECGVGIPAKRPRPLRCLTCDKRVGVLGFTCRCGGQFCQNHRYPDKHQCPFDRKTAERAKLKEENPVVLSDKIERL